ncbi:MAG: YIP1 family protein [Candidatus Aminicenantes bacterium]|nr:YIP1 family protein [Candidatus Aminicenantes bacterium]
MNEFVADFIGVVGNPGQTIARAMEKRRWKAALAVILLATALITFVTFPITKAEQARFIRDSEMADRFSDEQLAGLDRFTPAQRATGAAAAAFFTALALVVGAFFVYLFFKIGGAEGLYANYFSAVVQASLLDMLLGGVLRAALIMVKKTMMVHTGLTMFFPGLDIRSLSFLVLSQFDFFSLWYLAALALGIAVYARIAQRKSFFIVALYFLFKSLVFVAFSLITMKMMGL